jgi:hypothetical protein
MIDQVITWAQAWLGEEYLVDGELRGHSVTASRAPQRFGFGTLDEVVGDA